MTKLGPWIIMRVDEEPFYQHFKTFWSRMPSEMKDAARDAAIHVKYRPGMKPQAPQPDSVTMNTDGQVVTG
jgi:hypothetical protein